jgi:hypothetical protein
MEEKVLKDAQYRKGLSIAFFNATNAAIEMCKGMNVHEQTTLDKIVEVRNWLLEEHKNYYATVIANVGKNYDSQESIAKLKATKDIEELKSTWIAFSEDERKDGEIIKVLKELKTKYETIQ